MFSNTVETGVGPGSSVYSFAVAITGTQTATVQLQGLPDGVVFQVAGQPDSQYGPTLTLVPNVPQFFTLYCCYATYVNSLQSNLDIVYTVAGGQQQSVVFPIIIEAGQGYYPPPPGNDSALVVQSTSTLYGDPAQLLTQPILAGSSFWVDLAAAYDDGANYPANVAVSVAGLPTGVTASPFSNNGAIVYGQPAEWVTTVGGTATPGTYLITVTGTSGTGANAWIHTTLFALTVPTGN
jgi:hypothetical protein